GIGVVDVEHAAGDDRARPGSRVEPVEDEVGGGRRQELVGGDAAVVGLEHERRLVGPVPDGGLGEYLAAAGAVAAAGRLDRLQLAAEVRAGLVFPAVQEVE